MRRFLPLTFCTVLAGLMGACDWFGDPTPDTIRIRLDGDAEAFTIVTSTEFLAARNEGGEFRVEVFNADTSVVSLPFEDRWDISGDHRFFLLGIPVDSMTVSVRLRVHLDDSATFDGNIEAMIEDPVRYIYLFNQRVLREFELL